MTTNKRYRNETFLAALSMFGYGEAFTTVDLVDKTRGLRNPLSVQQAGRLLCACKGVLKLDGGSPTSWVRIPTVEMLK